MSEEQEFAKLAYDRSKYGVNRQDLDKMGEREVRDALNCGRWGNSELPAEIFVKAWLKDTEFSRFEKVEAERAAREMSTISWARHATYAAYAAAFFSAISIVVAKFWK